jgi:hypothetical protein
MNTEIYSVLEAGKFKALADSASCEGLFLIEGIFYMCSHGERGNTGQFVRALILVQEWSLA